MTNLTRNQRNEIQIRELVENWAKAVRTRDLPTILAHHSDNIVMYDVPEPFESVGINAYRKTWDTFFADTKVGVFDIQELHIVADEQVAFCYATMKCEYRSTPNEFIELRFRLTIGLTKTNHQWTIVHEHHSIPSK